MKASVIIPVYNAEKYVAQSVQSILDQSFKDFELIIVNDCSTDSSLEIIKKINDPRIKILDLAENIGNASAMNKGIEIASGEYIFRMDSDDIAMPSRLEKQIKYMDEHPNCAVCGSWVKFFEGSEVLKNYPQSSEEIKANLLFLNCLAHPSVAIRKKFLDESGLLYTNEFPHAEDYDLWTKISKIAEIHNIPEVLLDYRIHKNQIRNIFQNVQTSSAYGIMKRQVSDFLGSITLDQEKACWGIINILVGKENTEEYKKLIEELFEDILEQNNKKEIYDNEALLSLGEYLKKKGRV